MLRFSEKSGRSRLSRTAALRLLGALLAFVPLLVSCATIPSSRPTTGWFAVLPDPSPDSLYVSADVGSSWSLFEPLVAATVGDRQELERVIENLDRLHARIRLSPSGSAPQLPEFSLIILGTLSPGSVACQLNLDPSWERVVLDPLPVRGCTSSHWSYRTYWRTDQLQIAAPARGILFVSGGSSSGPDVADSDPAATGSGGAETLLRRLHSPGPQTLPAQAREASDTADIFLYIPDPLTLASIQAASAAGRPAAQDPGALLRKLPIRQGWVSARRQASDPAAAQAGKTKYELEAVCLLEQVENPRSVEMLLRLMLTLWLRKVQVEDPVATLKAVNFRTDSDSVRIESLVLGDREIASFLANLLPESLESGQMR